MANENPTTLYAISSHELSSITNFQKSLHYNKESIEAMEKEKNPNSTNIDIISESTEANEVIYSNHYGLIKKYSWGTIQKAPMRISYNIQNDGYVSFKVHEKMDHLIKTYITAEFPIVKVKPEYEETIQICWTHNLGHNFYDSISLMFNDKTIMTLNSKYLDFHAQMMMDSHKRKLYRKLIGDEKYVGDWGKQTIKYTTTTPIPFGYSKDTTKSILLHKIQLDNLLHVVKYKTKLNSLIRMRKFNPDTNTWEHIKFKYKYVSISGISDPATYNFKRPLMWAEYDTIMQDEKEWLDDFYKIPENEIHPKFLNGKLPIQIYVDLVHMLPPIIVTSNSNIIVPLNYNLPCKGIFWMCHNNISEKLSYHSNYTTDPINADNGENPLEVVSMKYTQSGKYKFYKFPIYHFNDIVSYYDTKSTCYQQGYNFFTLCHDINTQQDSQYDIVFENNSKAELILEFKNNLSDYNYTIHVGLLVTGRIDYDHDKNLFLFNGEEDM